MCDFTVLMYVTKITFCFMHSHEHIKIKMNMNELNEVNKPQRQDNTIQQLHYFGQGINNLI